MTRAYLDHNATSPLRAEARQAMIACLDLAGNASSVHAEGRAARAQVEDAREAVAAAIGCAPRQIVFTSGGTEANVMALSPAWFGETARPVRLFVSAVEHPSVLKGGQFGAGDVELLPVGADGLVDVEAASGAFRAWHERSGGAPFLVSVMLANNETGAIQSVAEIASAVHGLNGLIHCDAVQAFGKLPLDAHALGADLLSVSAHKIGGPKGAGALAVLRDDLAVAALFRGGGQEAGYRAGTENIPAIAAFGAVAGSPLQQPEAVRALRDRLEAEITKSAPGLVVFSHGVPRLPNTSCFAVAGMDAETLLMAFDLAGVAVSSGSACSSGKVARSHVLEAMGVRPELTAGAIRVSLGWSTTEAEIERFLAAWGDIYGRFAARRAA
jgi:cysteine desulfurase